MISDDDDDDDDDDGDDHHDNLTMMQHSVTEKKSQRGNWLHVHIIQTLFIDLQNPLQIWCPYFNRRGGVPRTS